MNHNYRVVYNESTQTFTAVAENATSRGKTSSKSVKTTIASAVLAGVALVSGDAMAAIIDGTPVAPSTTANPYTQSNLIISGSGGVANTVSTALISATAASNNIILGNGNTFNTKVGATTGTMENTIVGSRNQIGVPGDVAKELSQVAILGNDIKVKGTQSTGIGSNVDINGSSSIAIGGDDLDIASKSDLAGGFVVANALNTGFVATEYERVTGRKMVDATSATTRFPRTTAGVAAVAVGVQSRATGALSTAIGTSSQSIGLASAAFGIGSKATGGASLSMGSASTSDGESSVAVGNLSKSVYTSDVAIGRNSSSESVKDAVNPTTVGGVLTDKGGVGAIAIGNNSVSKGSNDHLVRNTTDNKNELTNGVVYKALKDSDGDIVISKDGVNAYTAISTSVGNAAYADQGGTAIGDGAKSIQLSVAVGSLAQAQTTGGVAIGAAAFAKGNTATAIGRQATAIDDFAQAIGNVSIAQGKGTLAIGHSANAEGYRAISIGSADIDAAAGVAGQPGVMYQKDAQTHAKGKDSLAIVAGSKAYGENTVAIGRRAIVGTRVNVGTTVTATGAADNAIAIGTDSNASNIKSIAIGTGAKAFGENAISIGTGNIVTGKNSGTIGDPTVNEGTASYTIGNNNVVGSNSTGAFVLGNSNQMGGTGTYDATGNNTASTVAETAAATDTAAVGNRNYVNTSSTYVLGSSVNTTGATQPTVAGSTVANSIYLGDNSTIRTEAGAGVNLADSDAIAVNPTTGTTAGATGKVSDATVGTITYSGFAGATGVGAVSVGSAGAERRIMNVAAGQISDTSTDAINGSQLYATNKVIGNLAGSVATALGGNSTVGNDGKITAPSYTLTSGNPSTGTTSTFNNVGGAIDALNKAVNQPISFTGDNGATTSRKLGSTLQIVAGNAASTSTTNLKTTVSDGKVEISMANAPTFTGTVTAPTFTTGGSNPITIANNAITGLTSTLPTNTTAGSVPSPIDNTKAATLGDVLNAGWNLQGDSTAKDFVKPYDTVNFVDGQGTDAVVTTDATTNTSTVKYDVKVDGTSIVVDSATGVLKATAQVPQTTTLSPATNGSVAAPSVAEGNKFVTATNIATAINNSSFNIADNAGTVQGKVNPGDTVQYVNGTNTTAKVTTEANGTTKIQYDVVGNTTTSASTTGVVSTTTPTSLVSGQNLIDAINKSGFSVTSGKTTGSVSGTTNELVNPGETLTFQAGDNMVLAQSGSTFTYSVSQSPVFTGTVTAPTFTTGGSNPITIANNAITG
ncbi:beta strand repeat-containing protein, partial [Acinetobacter sp. c3-l95]|uniref:beta strand repeat-containing protein n=1 Tax=Acinetobacter sp. c3-l95 TaxID=3342804 RepID=UPI0035B99061